MTSIRAAFFLAATILLSCSKAPTPLGSPPAQSGTSAPGGDASPMPTMSATAVPPEPPIPDADKCHQPVAQPACDGGWCTIPSGCFIKGSPHSEWGRARYDEEQAAVTLTRSFRIQQHEATVADWAATGLPVPVPEGATPSTTCTDPECPVAGLTWYDAMAFANALSEKHSPPLPPCYNLSSCTGSPGKKLVCGTSRETSGTVYDCPGFRLPTDAEWEYAARAGTTSAFYAGEITKQKDLTICFPDPVLARIAWYCDNSGGVPHRVGGLQPNGWGLYDMSGNVVEWTTDHASGLPDPQTIDPGGLVPDLSTGGHPLTRGGSCRVWPSGCRSAARLAGSPDQKFIDYGVRLVQTIRAP